MKKATIISVLLFTLVSIQLSAQNCATDLFFSEYLEGSSNNKALEIFNPTDHSIDLSSYKVFRFNNGTFIPSDSMQPFGILNPGDVYVMGNPSAVAAIITASDTLHTITFFNGDDAVMLKNMSSGDTLDILGQIGTDPGTYWVVGTGATSEFTLVRDSLVCHGSKLWYESVLQWIVYPQNTDTLLGSHHMESFYGYDSTNICQGQGILISGVFETTPGIYYDTLCSKWGCDSIIEITLQITAVDTAVQMINDTLYAMADSASYQWINCTGPVPVPGANQQAFAPIINGHYAVVVIANGCTDTSACHWYLVSSMDELNRNVLECYPNPFDETFTIKTSSIGENLRINLFDVRGQKVSQYQMLPKEEHTLDWSSLPSGVYILEVSGASVYQQMKIIKM